MPENKGTVQVRPSESCRIYAFLSSTDASDETVLLYPSYAKLKTTGQYQDTNRPNESVLIALPLDWERKDTQENLVVAAVDEGNNLVDKNDLVSAGVDQSSLLGNSKKIFVRLNELAKDGRAIYRRLSLPRAN
jgi:hypothetical protein